jgi:hypothetical protein
MMAAATDSVAAAFAFLTICTATGAEPDAFQRDTMRLIYC